MAVELVRTHLDDVAVVRRLDRRHSGCDLGVDDSVGRCSALTSLTIASENSAQIVELAGPSPSDPKLRVKLPSSLQEHSPSTTTVEVRQEPT